MKIADLQFMTKISPLAPKQFPVMPHVSGVQVAGAACGLKRVRSPDLFLAELDAGTSIAGVFTRSRCFSAPVAWCRKALSQKRTRAIVVNSGNANAFTGLAGDRMVAHTVKAGARIFKCPEKEIFVASTGVIGEPMPPGYVADKLPGIKKLLAPKAWEKAAEAIMTTDTFAKGATRQAMIGGVPVTLNGIAKGSGMIAPDMATMLSFIFTDAAIPAPVLQKLLAQATSRSFNSITVDSDTSTSDTVLLCATGKGPKHKKIVSLGDRHLRDFREKLDGLMRDLAQQIVRDGEGASKLVTLHISGAASEKAARRIGLSVANSPLVKTAIAGGDANWGRVVMAVGKAGEKADRDLLSISMGGIAITRKGKIVKGYDENPVAAHLKGREIMLEINVGVGKGCATVWTCDLTHGYITINTNYRS
jgi:glutamate N-acetyltransferase/amino-acid N-acetyltransferase